MLLQTNTHKQEKHQHRRVIHFPDGLKFRLFFISFHYQKTATFSNKWFDNLCCMWEQSVCDNISCVAPAVVFYLYVRHRVALKLWFVHLGERLTETGRTSSNDTAITARRETQLTRGTRGQILQDGQKCLPTFPFLPPLHHPFTIWGS